MPATRKAFAQIEPGTTISVVAGGETIEGEFIGVEGNDVRIETENAIRMIPLDAIDDLATIATTPGPE